MNIIESLKLEPTKYIVNDNIAIKICDLHEPSEPYDPCIFYELYITYKKYIYEINNSKGLAILDDWDNIVIHINLNKRKIECAMVLIKCIHNILKNNNDINWIKITKVVESCDINKCIDMISYPNIKKISMECSRANNLFFKIDWKKTYIRFFDCWDIDNHDNMMNWIKVNPQVYAIDVGMTLMDDILCFACKNPNNSLLYGYINSVDIDELIYNGLLLKNKRIYAKNQIFILLLISKSKHKYIKYIPKPIVMIILNYMYDIDYMIMHDKLID